MEMVLEVLKSLDSPDTAGWRKDLTDLLVCGAMKLL